MDSSLCFDTKKKWMAHKIYRGATYKGSQSDLFYDLFLSLKNVFILANIYSAESGEMPWSAACHLGLTVCKTISLLVSSTKGLTNNFGDITRYSIVIVTVIHNVHV